MLRAFINLGVGLVGKLKKNRRVIAIADIRDGKVKKIMPFQNSAILLDTVVFVRTS